MLLLLLSTIGRTEVIDAGRIISGDAGLPVEANSELNVAALIWANTTSSAKAFCVD